MRYCDSCGNSHECEASESGREKAEVAIARLNTTRDIEVARIQSAAGVKIAGSDSAAVAAHAEGVEEGIGVVIGAQAPDEPEAEGAAIVIDASGGESAGEELLPEMAPPEVPVTAAAESGGAGWWDGYH